MAERIDVDTPSDRSRHRGDVIVWVDAAGTAVFVVTAVVAAALFTSGVQWIAAVTAMTLFFAGIAAFIWSFWNAVQRSRGEQVSVTQLYLLAGGVAPTAVRTRMLFLVAVQVVAGLATAIARPDQPDGSPGTSLALGVLVPVFGLGLNGLWAAFHGTYRERTDTADAARGAGSTAPGAAIDKNEDHG